MGKEKRGGRDKASPKVLKLYKTRLYLEFYFVKLHNQPKNMSAPNKDTYRTIFHQLFPTAIPVFHILRNH